MASETANNGAKITLYWLEQSRSQRILWLLEELNLAYELKTFKRGKDKQAGPELKAIHPLGKSPVISVESPATTKPRVIAESGLIVEFLTDHFGSHLVPTRYAEGKEGQIGGETEEWMRYRYFMHYAEGSLMSLLLIGVMTGAIKNAPVPFFIKPITNAVAGKVESGYLGPNLKTHFNFLEDQIKTSPGGGQFLCGKDLTAADILMSFPLEAAYDRGVIKKEEYPTLAKLVLHLREQPGYKKAVQKIVDAEGSFKAVM